MTTGSAANAKPAPDPATSGLEGIVAARTPLSEVDGLKGVLTIRGYDIEEIASKISLEEAAYLLWHGKLPTRSELEAQNRRLVGYRRLPDEARTAVQLAARRMEPMDALRFAVAALTADDPAPGDISHRSTRSAPRLSWRACPSSSGCTSGSGAASRSSSRAPISA